MTSLLSRMPLAVALCCAVISGAAAQTAPTPTGDASTAAQVNLPSAEDWAIHAQSTFVDQFHPGFASAYRGPNSLDPGSRGDETVDATIFAGARPWKGGEIWIDAEMDQGFGLNNTQGVAGFPSAEAYKVGSQDPYVRIPRLFARQTVDFGGATSGIDPDQNVLGGTQTARSPCRLGRQVRRHRHFRYQ